MKDWFMVMLTLVVGFLFLKWVVEQLIELTSRDLD